MNTTYEEARNELIARIKETKRDIHQYGFSKGYEIESEIDGIYTYENLLYEDDKILYAWFTEGNEDEELNGLVRSFIVCTKEEFMQMKHSEIVKLINTGIYYNS